MPTSRTTGGCAIGSEVRARATRSLVRRIAGASLLPGDRVQIRPAEEILATLDGEGKLEGLPFMPEMLRFCGQTVTVSRRADKTCDTIHGTGLRRMHDTVHLADLRCDGSAHGDCQAGCLLFWKEQWLRPVGRRGTEPPSMGSARSPGLTASRGMAPPTLANEQLSGLARVSEAPSGEVRYRCQATELFAATSPLPWWVPTQYPRDVLTGNTTPIGLVRGLVRWLSVRVQFRINGSGVPGVKGRLGKTPAVALNLAPGERVRVRSRREIERTLDTSNRNRGLTFDVEMLRYCGGEFSVLRRVSTIIDERTGSLVRIPGDCIVLDGVTCPAEYRLFCPRRDYPYWREVWLSRAAPSALDRSALAPDQHGVAAGQDDQRRPDASTDTPVGGRGTDPGGPGRSFKSAIASPRATTRNGVPARSGDEPLAS